jgi:hypothetical protein
LVLFGETGFCFGTLLIDTTVLTTTILNTYLGVAHVERLFDFYLVFPPKRVSTKVVR